MDVNLLQHYANLINNSEDINEIYDLTCKCIVDLTCASQCDIYNTDYFQLIPSRPTNRRASALPAEIVQTLQKLKISTEDVFVIRSLGKIRGKTYSGILISKLKIIFVMTLRKPHKVLPPSDEILSRELGHQVLIATEKDRKLKSSQLLDKLVEQACRLIDGSRGGFHKYDEKSKRLIFVSGFNRYLSISMSSDEGLAGYLVRTEKEYLIEDNYNNSALQHAFYRGNRDYPSVLKVLLKFDNRILGVLSVDAELGRKFRAKDAKKLIKFGQDHIVPEMLRPELLSRLEQINNFTAKVAYDSASGNLRSTLETIVNGCKEIIGCASSTLYVYKEDSNEFYLRPVYDGLRFPKIEIKQEQVPNNTIFQRDFKKPYKVTNIKDDEYSNDSPFIKREKIKAYLAIPLNFHKEDGLRGILFVNFRTFHTFTSDEINLASSIANQATVAIQNDLRHRQIGNQLKIYQTLRDINLDLTRNIDSRQFFKTLVQKAANLLNAPGAGLREYDEGKGVLYLIAHWNRKNSMAFIKTGDGIAGRLVQKGAPPYMIVNDYDEWIAKRTPSLKGYIHGAVVAVPLRWQGKPIGILYVNDKLGRIFTDKDADQLLLFADQASVALAKYRLIETASKISNTASTTGTLILANQSLDVSLKQLVENAKKMIEGCEIVVLYLVDQKTKLLKNPPYHTKLRFPKKIKPGGFISRTSRIYQIFNSSDYIVGPFERQFLFNGKGFIIDEGIKSYAAIPLRTRQGDLGLLFAHYRDNHRFSDQEIEILHRFADQASVAIQNSQAKEEILERAKALDLLSKISNRITSKLSPNELFQEIVEGAVELTSATSGVIHLIDELGNQSYTISNSFKYPKGGVFAPIRLSQQIGITWRAIQSGNRQVFDEIKENTPLVHPDLYKFGIRSMLAYPLKLEGKVLGVLFLNSKTPYSFERIEDSILEQFANHASTAIYKARQISILEELERRQKEFVTIVVHELHRPLAHMQNSIRYLSRHLSHGLETQRSVEAIDQSIQHMAFLVNNLYNARRIQEHKINIRQSICDFGDVVKQAVEVAISTRLYIKNAPDIKVMIPSGSIYVNIDNNLIKEVIINLIHNAIKFSDSKVNIHVTTNKRNVKFRVVNDGNGIPKDKLHEIMKFGYQMNNNPLERGYEGMGVGLYISYEFLKLHNTKLSAKSAENLSTEFAFTLEIKRPRRKS